MLASALHRLPNAPPAEIRRGHDEAVLVSRPPREIIDVGTWTKPCEGTVIPIAITVTIIVDSNIFRFFAFENSEMKILK